MQFTIATIAAAAAFLPALVSAHVAMVVPSTVFQEVGTNSSPLDPDGANYPCFVTTGSVGDLPEYAPGSQQTIGLMGSAIHGGGSCQISVTYDNPPTKDSVFRVIKSFQGACPSGSESGNLAANPELGLPGLDYTLPSHMPSGTAVIAWTWFNKIGNREMYMRCAPIKIGGSNTDKTKYNALPEIFKANIGNGCSTTEGTNVIFPNPGSDLVTNVSKDLLGEPVGNCGSTVPEYSAPVLVEVPATTSTPVSAPTQTYAPLPDVTKAPVPTSAPVNNDTPTKTKTRKTKTTATPAPTPTSITGGCVNGAVVCTSTTTWSMCDHGKLTPMGPVAPGTVCKNGEMVLARRTVRFSHEHIRRRHGSSL